MPVTKWGEPPTNEVFVSVEQTPPGLADIQKALPEFKKELREKWQIESVTIETRKLRLKNPIDSSQGIVHAGGVYIVIRLLRPSVDIIGKEISKHVRRWLKRFDKTKKKKRKS
jgi:hypothetical protein